MRRVIIMLLVLSACGNSRAGYVNVTPDEAYEIYLNKSALIIDVRTPEEYNAGHIPGAVLMDWNSDMFEELAGKLDKSRPYLVYCRSGVRSAKASSFLSDSGFSDIKNMSGGFNEWSRRYPVEK